MNEDTVVRETSYKGALTQEELLELMKQLDDDFMIEINLEVEHEQIG
jgi:hypothetical protein